MNLNIFIILLCLIISEICASNINIKFSNDLIAFHNVSTFGPLLKIQESNEYFLEGFSNNANIILYSDNTILHFFNSTLSTTYGPTIRIKENLRNVTVILENTKIKNENYNFINVNKNSEINLIVISSSIIAKNIFETEERKLLRIEKYSNKIYNENTPSISTNNKQFIFNIKNSDISTHNKQFIVNYKFYCSCTNSSKINYMILSLTNILNEIQLLKNSNKYIAIPDINCEIRSKEIHDLKRFKKLFSKWPLKNKNIIKNKIVKNKLKLNIVVSISSLNVQKNYLFIDRLINSLLHQTIIPYKIILTLRNEDYHYLSHFIKLLVENELIEIVFIRNDLKAFNKYYYIPNKYKSFPIVVVDDNVELEKSAIENLTKSYILNPNAVSARRVYKMAFDKSWNLRPFNYWIKDYKKENKPNFHLFAINGAGTLFPPNVLNFNKKFIFSFRKAMNAPDFVLKYFELTRNLKTVYVKNNYIFSPLNIKSYVKSNKILNVIPNDNQLRIDFGKNIELNKYKNIMNEKILISDKVKKHYLDTINYNKMTNNTLIISMTSYPARIYGVYDVFISLLHQSSDHSSYQCFLTLAEEEFINGVKDLPSELQLLIQNGWVKLIWYHNIYSHKKLIPILQIYPENDILIVDDDIIRPYKFIEIFQKDHKKYPKDIICGSFSYYLDNEMKFNRFKYYKGKKCGGMNSVPNIIFKTGRPANGSGGVLYPKHTFTDPRFFNESLFMTISKTSDELWQFAFNIMENREFRQTSIIYDNSVNYVKGSQRIKSSLFRINKFNYPIINEMLIKTFPEYKRKALERQQKIIVSLTSYKQRFKKLHLVLESIFKNTMKPSKIVLTINKNDQKYLTEKLKILINRKKIELIVTDNNLKSHLKYFEVMKRYRDYAIITIDDDIIYTKDLIKSLFNSYINNPNCIHARRVHKIMTKNNKVLPYSRWLKQYTYELNPSFELIATTGQGTLFPPNILNITDENIKEIYKCITADDIYLKYLEMKRNIKTVWVPNNRLSGMKELKDERTQKYALYKKNIGEKLNDACFKIFSVI